MNYVPKDSWKVAVTYIGTVVGAGFASGQEVLKFFSSHGLPGIAGVCLSALLFSVSGILVLGSGRALRAVSYKEVFEYICGRPLGFILEKLITLFLFATLSVLLAGSGAVLAQQLDVPYLLGTLLTVVLTIITVLSGIKGIIRANSIIVPLLTVGCLIVGLSSISISSLICLNVNQIAVPASSTPHWLLSAFTYVAYNLTLSTGVLAPLGHEIGKKNALLAGGLIGGLLLGALASLINLAILSNLAGPLAKLPEVPMLQLAASVGRPFQLFYAIILWAEIFTTIIGNVYGVTTRIVEGFNLSYKRTLTVIMLLAVCFSQVGFSRLVGFLYPLFGYVSLIFLVALFTRPLKRK
ncbi:YkvI family membrane protein [Thermincola potens]|uniref:Membrane protein YkvI n=1 Tax=Thermincola potens (strain JR) TaxID=635013 RepID=D5XF50_THEPJ|nr:hypothetical protein [Thermincola potens]ADG82271.1 conserved hypothetical protein [Thermincola potens JR]